MGLRYSGSRVAIEETVVQRNWVRDECELCRDKWDGEHERCEAARK